MFGEDRNKKNTSLKIEMGEKVGEAKQISPPEVEGKSRHSVDGVKLGVFISKSYSSAA